jgi:hypothetical protein
MLAERGTTLTEYDGFKPELTAGGQGGDVSRHVYGHAGAVLAYPHGYSIPPGLAASYFEQGWDYLQCFQKGRTKEESVAEIAGDRAARKVASALNAAMKTWREAEEVANACVDTRKITSDLRDALESILCVK